MDKTDNVNSFRKASALPKRRCCAGEVIKGFSHSTHCHGITESQKGLGWEDLPAQLVPWAGTLFPGPDCSKGLMWQFTAGKPVCVLTNTKQSHYFWVSQAKLPRAESSVTAGTGTATPHVTSHHSCLQRAGDRLGASPRWVTFPTGNGWLGTHLFPPQALVLLQDVQILQQVFMSSCHIAGGVTEQQLTHQKISFINPSASIKSVAAGSDHCLHQVLGVCKAIPTHQGHGQCDQDRSSSSQHLEEVKYWNTRCFQPSSKFSSKQDEWQSSPVHQQGKTSK